MRCGRTLRKTRTRKEFLLLVARPSTFAHRKRVLIKRSSLRKPALSAGPIPREKSVSNIKLLFSLVIINMESVFDPIPTAASSCPCGQNAPGWGTKRAPKIVSKNLQQAVKNFVLFCQSRFRIQALVVGKVRINVFFSKGL